MTMITDFVTAQLEILEKIEGPETPEWRAAVRRRDAAMRKLDDHDRWAIGVLGGTLTNISRGA